jgi:hypothetical protein
VFLDEVGLQGCGDFVGRLQRVVDGQVPCCVVNHAASIAPLASLVTGNKIVRLLIMRGINLRLVSVRRVSVTARQKGQ